MSDNQPPLLPNRELPHGGEPRPRERAASSHRRPVGAPSGSAARTSAAMGGTETNGGARGSSSGKLEVRPTGRPVSLRDVSLPEVSSLTRAQMNWQLVRRVFHRPVNQRRECGAVRSGAPRGCRRFTPWARRPYCEPASRRLAGGEQTALWRAAAKYAAAAEPCF